MGKVLTTLAAALQKKSQANKQVQSSIIFTFTLLNIVILISWILKQYSHLKTQYTTSIVAINNVF